MVLIIELIERYDFALDEKHIWEEERFSVAPGRVYDEIKRIEFIFSQITG